MIDELKNQDLIDAIKYWSEKSPIYERVFSIEAIRQLINICDAVIEVHEDKVTKTIIEDFVAGLTLVPSASADNELANKLDQLVKPMISLILKFLKSDEYVSYLLEQRIDGDEVVNADRVTIPITVKKIMRLIKDTNLLVLDNEDIERVQVEFRDQKVKRYRMHGNDIKPPDAFENEKILKTPDKWYAMYHWILIFLGKAKAIEGGKMDIIEYGKHQYGTGEGFYKQYKDFEINNIPTFINSLPKKDRRKWKDIITDISKNDNDVLLWLKRQPN